MWGFRGGRGASGLFLVTEGEALKLARFLQLSPSTWRYPRRPRSIRLYGTRGLCPISIKPIKGIYQ